MDEAYAAVDRALGCDVDPVGEPIVPTDESVLTSEQKLCSENVQIDLYSSDDALQKALEIWNGSHQGEVRLALGGNWMVVDVTGVATGESTTWDIEGLAKELNAEYSVAGA
ncbi:hypothetical protein DXT87_18615 [Arthrobacter sp. AET 35A]|nr:hypothetical protein [Arthrobacter sp. AET 35A]